jgi:hypothetical protein
MHHIVVMCGRVIQSSGPITLWHAVRAAAPLISVMNSRRLTVRPMSALPPNADIQSPRDLPLEIAYPVMDSVGAPPGVCNGAAREEENQ